jgi:hypothetical protein
MGVIKQGILGGVSGKVANVVGSSWKGIAYLKALPLSVANPNTAAQQLQRGKMREIVEDARLLLAALLQVYWNPFAQAMSGYNAYVKENIDAYDQTSLATPADLFASRGTLLSTPDAAGVEGGTVNDTTVTWTDNSGTADALGTDEMHALVWNETQDEWLFWDNFAIRSAATGGLTATGYASSDVIHVWVFPARPDVSKTSDSVYSTYTIA